jgi:hypothetical protein
MPLFIPYLTHPFTKIHPVAFLKIKIHFATAPLHFTLLQNKMQRPQLQQHCCIFENKK